VLVAPRVAAPWQFVYIEQPELHLHPRAQVAMAGILAEAANRGVRVVVETHSALILRGLQTLIATGDLPHDSVAPHWFQRDAKTGFTKVTPHRPGPDGTFGEWPVAFDDVNLDTDQKYLDAVEMNHLATNG